MAKPVISYGWDGSAWRKLPMVWGYSERLVTSKSATDASVGTNYLQTDDPEAGEIWVVQAIAAQNADTDVTRIFLEVRVGTHMQPLFEGVPDGAARWVFWTGEVVLATGDVVRAGIEDCLLNDDIHLYVWGYKMKIAE